MRVCFLVILATLVGCDRPALSVDPPKPKEEFSGFITTGTPFADSSSSNASESPIPASTSLVTSPEAQKAIGNYADAVHALHNDPSVRPSENFNVIENPGVLQTLNNAIINHVQAIEEAQDRVFETMNPAERKRWANGRKKEIDQGEDGQ